MKGSAVHSVLKNNNLLKSDSLSAFPSKFKLKIHLKKVNKYSKERTVLAAHQVKKCSFLCNHVRECVVFSTPPRS